MNKIINGKRYNTESAAKLGEISEGQGYRDFSFWRETLYRTRSGNYFIHGEGGGYSKYAEVNGDNREYGEKIIPLSYEEAQKWVEKALTADEYETIFGVIEDDAENAGEEHERLEVILSCATVKTLREVKANTGATLSWLVQKALKDAGY